MTVWSWYAGELDEICYDLAEEPTREMAIETASWAQPEGYKFQIVEAKTSTAKKYEGSDFVPFLKTRNHEIITVGKKT